MATKKKPIKKQRATLDSVLSTVERGFAAVAYDIADIKSKMATKDDIANLGGQLTSVERELKSIRRDLDRAEEPDDGLHALRIQPIAWRGRLRADAFPCLAPTR